MARYLVVGGGEVLLHKTNCEVRSASVTSSPRMCESVVALLCQVIIEHRKQFEKSFMDVMKHENV